MVDIQDITEAAEAALMNEEGAGVFPGALFLVDVKGRGDEFEVTIDADGTGEDGRPNRVTVDDCIRISKAIEARFDRDQPGNDFSLTVSSAGIGQPLRVARQYRKLVGRQVEIVTTGGAKITGTLEGFENGEGDQPIEITLSYPEKQKLEGKKRPEMVTVTKTFPLTEVKTTAEHIDFK